jgi:hypothetical protein
VHPTRARGAPEVRKEVLIEEEEKKDAAVETAGDKSVHDDGAWWRKRERVCKMGEALGVAPRAGERYAAYKDRVFRSWQASRANGPDRSDPPRK